MNIFVAYRNDTAAGDVSDVVKILNESANNKKDTKKHTHTHMRKIRRYFPF